MMFLMNGVYFMGFFSVLCDAYKILIAYPMPQKSHKILGDGYVDNLLEAGHEVTLITAFPRDNNPHPNLSHVDVSANLKISNEPFLNLESAMHDETITSKYTVFSTMYNIARGTVESQGVQRLLEDPEQQFDLVVAEWLFCDFYAGFAAVFNCPYIWAVSMNPGWLALWLVEAARNPEYYPDVLSANTPPFSHVTRLQEFTHQMNVMAMKKFIFNRLEKQLYEDNIVPILRSRGRNVPNFNDLLLNASLLIVNSHATLAQTVALPPNCVTVGGYHIGSRVPPLPQDLQKLMDKATAGVIYFSMGTYISSETFPKRLIQGLLDIFKGLKQLVLWKFRDEMSDRPENVHFLPWAPQQSILKHPNCILFITHGGYLSMTEAVHFGVPLVVIPVFADQFANAETLQLRGIGIKVDLTYNIVEDLKAAIGQVIGNSRYKEKVEQWSLIYHDQKSPQRRLVDWVEYVVRTRGAAHLRSPAILMPWYQQVYLDLLLLIMIVTIVVVLIMIMLVRCLIQK